MAVVDLWYLRSRGPDSERVASRRHGRGRRFRVDFLDAAGHRRSRTFDDEATAIDFDLACRAPRATETHIDPVASLLTFPEYAARWRAAREFSWEVETRRRIPGNLAYHLNPAFPGPIRAITTTDVLYWLSTWLSSDRGVAPSSMKLYFDLFNTIMRSAEIDRVIPANPCRGIKLASVFRDVSREPRWIPTEKQVLRLFDVVPERYHAALWLGAGQGCRIGEVLGLEDAPRCFDLDRGELHVVQQLQYDTAIYGGFFLKAPKGRSAGTVLFEQAVQRAVEDHLDRFGTTAVSLVDATLSPPQRRPAGLLFTDAHGRPFHDRRWAEYWVRWRTAAGWPARYGTFHALRHFCATVLLANGVDPQHVQKTLRHGSLQVTLATYVHWLPRSERPTDVVSGALRRAGVARHSNRYPDQPRRRPATAQAPVGGYLRKQIA